MNRKFSFVLSFLLALSFAVLLPLDMRAQKQTTASNKQPESTADKAAAADKDKKAEEARLEGERRASATSLLLDVAEESAKFKDLVLRARVQARAADTLWDADQDRARALFRKAWDSADASDREALRKYNEEVKAAMKERGSWAGTGPIRVREEVLKLASKRDRALGEEFLKKLDDAQKEEADKAENDAKNDTEEDPLGNQNDPYELSASQKQRISVALSLLDSGDVERAVQFADPALFRVSYETLNFLCRLRPKNAAMADQRYSMMLGVAASNPSMDANAVSLLSSYIFTPFQFIRYGKEGSTSSNNFGQGNNPPFDNDELRLAFIRFAEQVLLRPAQVQEQAGGATTGAWGTFKTIERLLPHIERYGQPETATAFRAQMATLQPGKQAMAKPSDDDIFFPRNSAADEGKDFVQLALERAERAKTQDERDNVYFSAAVGAANRNDQRARTLMDKIENTEMRTKLRSFIDYTFIAKALTELAANQKKEEENAKQKPAANQAKTQKKTEDKKTEEKKKPVTVDETLEMIRKGDITHFQRVWALLEVAHLFTKTDKEKATDLIEEAGNEAQRINNSDPERPQAVVGVATAFLELNRARAWEFVTEAVRAANSCESYRGEDARMVVKIQSKDMTSVMSSSLERFDLPNLFKALSKEDLNRAISQARSFGGESPRSTAIITIAQTVLQKKEEEKKPKTTNNKQ